MNEAASDFTDYLFMIVDENNNNALFWEITVQEAFLGCKTKICKTGPEAIEAAKGDRVRFFIASWELSPMSGLIFMQKVRSIYKYKHTPFLIFSNLLAEEDLALAEEFGIPDYLLKPFDKERVIEKIKSVIEKEKNMDPVQRTLRKIEDWIQEGKINEALKLIDSTLKPGPNAARAYTLNGDIWARTEHTEKAKTNYENALKHTENYPQALSGLGKLYLKMKNYDEAIKIFEILDTTAPKNLSRLVNLGTAYLGNGEEEKAEAAFSKVQELDDENSDAKKGLGEVAFSKGNMELAAKFFQESGKGDELASQFNNIGIAKVNQNKADEAIALYQNAMSVLPENSKAHLLEFNIGLAFKKSDRFGEAAEAFARSLLLKPSYVKAYQGMALSVREAQKRKQTFDKQKVQNALEKFKLSQTEEDEKKEQGGNKS